MTEPSYSLSSVMPTPKPPRPGWLIPALAALVAVVALVVGGMVLTRGGGGEEAAAGQSLTPTPEDSGAGSCRVMLEAYQSGKRDAATDPAVIAGLKSSRNPNLLRGGAALERFAVLPEAARLSGLGDLFAAVADIGIGCAAVGVPLPSDMLQFKTTSP